MTSPNNARTSITFDESALQRIPTTASTSSTTSDPNSHKQDWSIITPEKETWAYRERRRSSVWSKVDMPSSPKKTATERRGSILSVWSSGKDKDGRDVLLHDDFDDEGHEIGSGKVEVEEAGERRGSTSSEKRGADRRGSILSLWSKGTDENGRPVILHDDEEWKV